MIMAPSPWKLELELLVGAANLSIALALDLGAGRWSSGNSGEAGETIWGLEAVGTHSKIVPVQHSNDPGSVIVAD